LNASLAELSNQGCLTPRVRLEIVAFALSAKPQYLKPDSGLTSRLDPDSDSRQVAAALHYRISTGIVHGTRPLRREDLEDEALKQAAELSG
jgi:hypothetical protein